MAYSVGSLFSYAVDLSTPNYLQNERVFYFNGLSDFEPSTDRE